MDLVEDLNDLICWRTGSHHIWSLKRAQEERIVSMTALGVSFDFQLLVHDILSLFRSPLTVFALCEPISCTDGDQQWCKAAFFFFFNKSTSTLAVTDWWVREQSVERFLQSIIFTLHRVEDVSRQLCNAGRKWTIYTGSFFSSRLRKKKNWLQLVWMLSCY